jgi:hypothetical protein
MASATIASTGLFLAAGVFDFWIVFLSFQLSDIKPPAAPIGFLSLLSIWCYKEQFERPPSHVPPHTFIGCAGLIALVQMLLTFYLGTEMVIWESQKGIMALVLLKFAIYGALIAIAECCKPGDEEEMRLYDYSSGPDHSTPSYYRTFPNTYPVSSSSIV